MKFFWEVFVTLFVIIDPAGTVPLFLGLTRGRSDRDRNRLAWQATVVAFGVIVVFALFGRTILDYLGVGLAALEGAGGLLLLLVALELLTGNAGEPTQAELERANVAFVPLGTPLLAGPGAIVATMLFVQRVHGPPDGFALAAAIVAVALSVWLALRFALVVQRVLTDNGVELLTRIAGLLLAAIAVQLVANSAIAFAHSALSGGPGVQMGARVLVADTQRPLARAQQAHVRWSLLNTHTGHDRTRVVGRSAGQPNRKECSHDGTDREGVRTAGRGQRLDHRR